jgi:sugar (pentulose or hexulose) kinase
MKIGVDIGTSRTKAVLYDDDLATVDVRSRPTDIQRPAPGRYEHDLSSIVDSVIDLLAELAGDGVDVVAITGQGDGLWLLDADGRPVGPAISWMDDRGASECDRWAESGAAGEIFRRTGNAPFPGAGSAILASVLRSDPDRLDAAATATQCQHAVFQALTGVRVATRSAAMLGAFDPIDGDYDADLLRLTGLDGLASLLPPIADGAVAEALLLPEAAERSGLAPGTRVATGPYDLPAAALGAGVTKPGDGLLILGTTLACLVHQDSVEPEGEPAGLTLRTADDRGVLRAMPAMVGTAGLDWILDLVGASHGELNSLLWASRPGAGGVMVLPYLSPAGERAPFVDPAARGQWSGLSLGTTRADLVRAYCEGLAYAARHCFEAAGLSGTITVCGGGAASTALTTVLATVLGRPMMMTADAECTARGAILAAAGGELRGVSRPRAAEPEARLAEQYDQGYERYVDLVDELRRRAGLTTTEAVNR